MIPRTPGLATACLAAFSVMTAMLLSPAPSGRTATPGDGVLAATSAGRDAGGVQVVASYN